jgi:hypothetical protein
MEAVATRGTASNYLQRAPSPSGLADVIEGIKKEAKAPLKTLKEKVKK